MADRSVLHSSECLSMRHRTLPGYARAMKLLLWCCCIAQCLPVCRSMRQMMKFPTCIRHSNGIRAAGVSGWVVYIYMTGRRRAGNRHRRWHKVYCEINLLLKFVIQLHFGVLLLDTHIQPTSASIYLCVGGARGFYRGSVQRPGRYTDTQTDDVNFNCSSEYINSISWNCWQPKLTCKVEKRRKINCSLIRNCDFFFRIYFIMFFPVDWANLHESRNLIRNTVNINVLFSVVCVCVVLIWFSRKFTVVEFLNCCSHKLSFRADWRCMLCCSNMHQQCITCIMVICVSRILSRVTFAP